MVELTTGVQGVVFTDCSATTHNTDPTKLRWGDTHLKTNQERVYASPIEDTA